MEIEFRRSFLKSCKSVPEIKAYPMPAPVTGFPDIMIHHRDRFALVELKRLSADSSPELRAAQRQFWKEYVQSGGMLFISMIDETSSESNMYYSILIDPFFEKELSLSTGIAMKQIMERFADRSICRPYKTIRPIVLDVCSCLKEF